MFGLVYLRIAAAVAVAGTIFFSGWWINGYRWNLKYDSLVIQYKEAQIKAEQEARTKEQELQAAVDNERQIKDEQIRSIRNRLDSTLYQLRQRSLRPTDPNDPSAPKGATGSQLYREDGEFLIREAARADEIRSGLQECYSSYDHVRQTLNPSNR